MLRRRFTWERYCLVCVKDSQRIRLLDESQRLVDYGIKSEDQVISYIAKY